MNHCMVYPEFKSEVANETGKLGSQYPSNLFLAACGMGNLNTVQYLAELNTNLTESVDIEGSNGLHFAARAGKMDIVVYLIEELEIDPAAEGVDGRNAFLFACLYGNIEMVKYLAEQYPKLINSVDKYKANGLHYTALSGKIWTPFHLDTLVYLVEELEMDPTVDGYGRGAFLWACYFGNIETVKYLAEYFPKLINSVDKDNYNGLHLAASNGEVETLVYLFEKLGMNPTLEKKLGANVIIMTRRDKDIEIIEYLTEKYPTLIKIRDQ